VITEDPGFATQIAHPSHPLCVFFDYSTLSRLGSPLSGKPVRRLRLDGGGDRPVVPNIGANYPLQIGDSHSGLIGRNGTSALPKVMAFNLPNCWDREVTDSWRFFSWDQNTLPDADWLFSKLRR